MVPSQDPRTGDFGTVEHSGRQNERKKKKEELAYEKGPQVWHPVGLAEALLKMAERIPSPGRTNGTVVWVQRSWPSERTPRE